MLQPPILWCIFYSNSIVQSDHAQHPDLDENKDLIELFKNVAGFNWKKVRQQFIFTSWTLLLFVPVTWTAVSEILQIAQFSREKQSDEINQIIFRCKSISSTYSCADNILELPHNPLEPSNNLPELPYI